MRRPLRPEQLRRDFDDFVASVTAGLVRTACLVVWDLPTAEDLAQECLLQVARRWPKVRGMDYPAAYARKVLVNLAIDSSVRRARQQAELGSGQAIGDRADEAAAARLVVVETTSELAAALGELPARQRAVLVLRYFEDLSESQVAEVLGCSVGTVKSTASRALGRLRNLVADETTGCACVQPSPASKGVQP